MFSQAWNKYFPAIKILMKRSANGEQVLSMNRTDFERAGGGRKVKYTFTMLFIKGRLDNSSNHGNVAKELAQLLTEDKAIYEMMRSQHFELSMNTSSQLTIKNLTPAPAATEDIPEETDKAE